MGPRSSTLKIHQLSNKINKKERLKNANSAFNSSFTFSAASALAAFFSAFLFCCSSSSLSVVDESVASRK